MFPNTNYQSYSNSPFSRIKTLADCYNHKFKKIQLYENVMNNIEEDCAICIEKINDGRPIKQLSCFHLYHADCFNTWIEAKQDNICPSCNEPKTVKTLANCNELIRNLPQKCENTLCTLISSEFNAPFTENICPYPLATFPHKQPDKFLEMNQEYIRTWLAEQIIKKKSVSNFYTFYVNELKGPEFKYEAQGQPAILLIFDMQLKNKKSEKHQLYYTAKDINAGANIQECYQILLNDLRVDQLMLLLKDSYAQLFDPETDMFIYNYCYYQDKIFLKNAKKNDYFDIKLSDIFNPNTDRILSWNKLKNALTEENYKQLFAKNTKYKEMHTCDALFNNYHYGVSTGLFSGSCGAISNRSNFSSGASLFSNVENNDLPIGSISEGFSPNINRPIQESSRGENESTARNESTGELLNIDLDDFLI